MLHNHGWEKQQTLSPKESRLERGLDHNHAALNHSTTLPALKSVYWIRRSIEYFLLSLGSTCRKVSEPLIYIKSEHHVRATLGKLFDLLLII